MKITTSNKTLKRHLPIKFLGIIVLVLGMLVGITTCVGADPVTPTIAWDNPANITYGTALSGVHLNAIATDPRTGTPADGSLVYDPAVGYTLDAGSHKLSVIFNPTNTETYTTATKNVTINVTEKPVPVIRWESFPQEPVCGDTLNINGSASPGEEVDVFVTFEKTIPVPEGRFEYTLENVTIPEGLDNLFTVEARGVNNLNVRVKMVIWATKSSGASEGTATVSQSNVPAGTYTIKIDGNAGEGVSEVNLKITASQGIRADSNGNFSYSYNTTAVPPGNFEIKVGGVTKEITLRPREIEVPPLVLPVANFSANATEGYAPLLVKFNELSENAEAVAWDFNNDGIADSATLNPIHEFTTPGTYTVNMTAINENGTDFKLANITVSEKPAPVLPVANFSANKTEGFAPLSVQFNDSSENATSINWDFNCDGVSDSEERNPINEFATPGTYTVNLTAINVNGTDSKFATITVNEPEQPVLPVANFSADPAEGYAPLSVQFNDLSENAESVAWDFNNDGATDSEERSPVHEFTTQGNYTVNMTTTNGNGTDSKLATITVSEKPVPILPVANFSANVISGYAPLSVLLTDLSQNATSRSWDIGNDGIVESRDSNIVYVFTNPGTYTVNLTASNANGTDSKLTMITVLEQPILPVANFSTNITEGIAPLTVQFNDSSENATSVNWDFGDGSNSEERNPINEFATPGTYTVNLTASNENGTSSKSAKITVSEKPVLPVANFSTNVSEGYVPLSVQFNDLSENADTVAWDFNGDGISDSEERNPINEFATPGTYTVNLTAINANGTDSKFATITVLEQPILPVADFSASVTSGNAPLKVVFSDKSTGTPTKWKWTFGDGTSSTKQNPTHKYSKAGNYTVALTATNAAGSNTKTKTNYIKVVEKSVANFTSNVTSGKAPLSVAFTDKSTGVPTSWEWTFGDGANSTIQNPKHQYSQEGNYTVKLTVANVAGNNTTTKTNYIKVTTNTRPGIFSINK